MTYRVCCGQTTHFRRHVKIDGMSAGRGKGWNPYADAVQGKARAVVPCVCVCVCVCVCGVGGGGGGGGVEEESDFCIVNSCECL